MTAPIRVGAAALAAACILTWAPAASAQPRGKALGHQKKSTPSGGGASQLQTPGGSGALAGTGVRNFGSWLDDASVLAPGRGSVAISFALFRSPVFREFDLPVLDGGVGVTRRVQFGFSAPYYHASEPGGPAARGLGDVYLSTKVQLVDPGRANGAWGLSVTPVLEVLSGDPGPDASRYHWGLPVSAEVQRGAVRGFGSVGYFSRGSIFASGAVQASLTDRLAVTGSLTRSRSTRDDELSAALGLAETRTDVSGSVGYALGSAASIFAGVGRTLSRQDANAAALVLSGGAVFGFDAWRPSPRPRR